MKRIILCLSLFAFFGSQAQQINPVPDYVFSNKMSVGRNAVTDTAAYFSIGPRYGAIRGMMPPMVTDTASMSATKRNGLLIFSIQKNKYLYWDSVGSKWAEMAGTGGTAISSGDTASMLSHYIRAAGNGLTKSGQSLLVDTAAIATRTRVQKAVDSINTNVALKVNISDTASMLTPYTRGSGTTNYLPKFTGSRTFGNSVAFDNGGTELLVNTTTDAGAYALQVAGAIYNTTGGALAVSSGGLGIGTTSIPGSQKLRIAGGDVGLEGQYLYMVNASAQILLGASQEAQIVNSDAGSSMTFSRLGASAFMAFNVAGAERMRINNAGEIIVGGSDAGAFALQITGAIYNTTTITSGAPTGGIAKPWRLGEVNTVSPTSPNRTIRVEIDGTVYYIHAKTTND